MDKYIQFIHDDNSSLLFYILQIYGDLEIARGDTVRAISYYKEALGHSTNVSITHKTMYLHKKIAECLMENQLTRDEAKMHLKEYNILRDSLERNNKMVTDFILGSFRKHLVF